MTFDAAAATGCTILALAAALGALKCLADHLLASALIYAPAAAVLLGGAVHEAAAAL